LGSGVSASTIGGNTTDSSVGLSSIVETRTA
jgi:hypothetical protein